MTKPEKSFTPETESNAEEKEQNLRGLMRETQSVLVAYSGGVDSAYLALIATQELGENAFCVTGISPSVSQSQRVEAEKIARSFHFNYTTLETDELDNPLYQANPTNRCFHCKNELYEKLWSLAENFKIKFIFDGSNADDLKDFRPGKKAAVLKGVRSPLAEIGLTKKEIRELSKKLGLPTWDKPASPCLSSRIAYGVPVTIERLSRIERGEELLRRSGFREFRVRVHDELVRLEIAQSEMRRALELEMTEMFAREFRKIGFRYVTLDLNGFRSGAMNENLEEKFKTDH